MAWKQQQQNQRKTKQKSKENLSKGGKIKKTS